MDFARYERIKDALTILAIYKTRVSPNQYKALRKQARMGDPDGAIRVLKQLLEKEADT